MKTLLIVFIATVSLSVFAKPGKREQLISNTGRLQTATFSNPSVNLENSYNWSRKQANIPLKSLRGAAKVNLKVAYDYNGIKDGEKGLQVGDVQFFISELETNILEKMEISVEEYGKSLTTLDFTKVRHFILRVKYKSPLNDIDLVTPITIDAKGNLDALDL